MRNKKRIVLIVLLAISQWLNAQNEMRASYDTSYSKRSYHPYETFTIKIRVENPSTEDQCYWMQYALLTPDGKTANVTYASFIDEFAHEPPLTPENFIWRADTIKAMNFGCESICPEKIVKAGRSYTDLIVVVDQYGMHSLYDDRITAGTYYFKTIIFWGNGTKTTLDYPFPIQIRDDFKEEYFGTIFGKDNNKRYKNLENTYLSIDTCKNDYTRDRIILQLVEFREELKTLEEFKRYIGYLGKIKNTDQLLVMAENVVRALQPYGLSTSLIPHRLTLLKQLGTLLMKRDKRFGEMLWGYVYYIEMAQANSKKHYEELRTQYKSFFTSAQLTELETFLNKAK